MKPLVLVLKNVLLAFVLVSIGFALGREWGRRGAGAPTGPDEVRPAAGGKVVVYYCHATSRCATCNRIEAMARSLVETAFAGDLAAGRIEWRDVDFERDEALARRYGVASSCVVVARIEGGVEKDFQRLDDVWIHYADPPAFDDYVGAAIRGALAGGARP
jgi:hypothetical protein